MNNVDLSKLPMEYKCIECGASNVKLWRQCHTFLEQVNLRCRRCSEVEQDKILDGGDRIGWRVPAVPTDNGTFWGYTSVPEHGVAWWKALPDETDEVHLEMTVLPCGVCGTTYQVPGKVLPLEIQQAALDDGWGITEVDGRNVVACGVCSKDGET